LLEGLALRPDGALFFVA